MNRMQLADRRSQEEGIISTEQRLGACKQTRQSVAHSLFVSLQQLFALDDPIFEVTLRDAWLEEIRKDPQIYPDGWYLPPPHGIGVLFGKEADYSRMNYKSLRPEEMWPSNETALDRQTGIIYVYASPVDRKTGMIGDFGITLYFGKNSEIQTHLRNCLMLNKAIVDHARVGMSFGEITQAAVQMFFAQGLTNEVRSVTDPMGVNIGHTVPASYEDWTIEELAVLRSEDWLSALKLISSKRRFLSTQEALIVKDGMAFTLEPRLTVYGNSAIPMSSFHTIVLFKPDGGKELLTNFDELFQLVGMQYMLH